MITNKIKALAEEKARIVKLERLIAEGLPRELATLPGVYGFTNVGLFLRAVKAAAGKRSGSVRTKRRRRAKITDAVRAKVKKLVKSGKTGAHIAKVLDISLPSVQNIKKALGLVRGSKPSRKLKARSKPAKRATVVKPKKKKESPKKPVMLVSTPNQTPVAPPTVP